MDKGVRMFSDIINKSKILDDGKISIENRKYSLISLDLWDTVIVEQDEDIRQDMRAEYFARIAGTDKEKVKKAVAEAGKAFRTIYFSEHRTPLTEERVEEIAKNLKLQLTKEQKDKIVLYFSEVSLELKPPIREGVIDFIKLVASSEAKLVMISDTGYTKGTEMRKLLDFYGVFSCFDYFVFSDETGFAKPHEEPFKIVEKKFSNIAKDEMVHIGDNPLTDGAGAEKAGWSFIHVPVNL